MVVKYKNNNIEFEIEGSIDEVKEICSLIQSITIDNSTKESTDKDVLNEQEKKNYTKKKTKTTSGSKPMKLEIVDLKINNEREFIEEFKSYSLAKSITQKIYILVYLYKKHTGNEIINADIVHSLLNFAQIDTPKHLKQMLRNFVNQEKTFNKIDDDNFKIKFQTEDEINKLKP